MNTPTIGNGGRYYDRTGKVWRVYKEDKGYAYPYLAENGKGQVQSFTAEGRWSNLAENEMDLVSAL